MRKRRWRRWHHRHTVSSKAAPRLHAVADACRPCHRARGLNAKLAVDPGRDFAPIGLGTDVPMILVAASALSRQ